MEFMITAIVILALLAVTLLLPLFAGAEARERGWNPPTAPPPFAPESHRISEVESLRNENTKLRKENVAIRNAMTTDESSTLGSY